MSNKPELRSEWWAMLRFAEAELSAWNSLIDRRDKVQLGRLDILKIDTKSTTNTLLGKKQQ